MFLQAHWMPSEGRELKTLEDMEYRWTTTQEWTPHSGRVSALKTHVHPSAAYPVRHIPTHVSLVHTPLSTCISRDTERTVLVSYIFSVPLHFISSSFTTHLDVTLSWSTNWPTPALAHTSLGPHHVIPFSRTQVSFYRGPMGTRSAEDTWGTLHGLKSSDVRSSYRSI